MEELIMASEKVTKLIEDVKALTVLELSELVRLSPSLGQGSFQPLFHLFLMLIEISCFSCISQ